MVQETCAVVRLLLVVGLMAGTASADDLRAELEVIREGYRANQAAFRQGKCRFTYAIRSADSEADALKEKWNDRQPLIARTYTFYFDGDTFTIKTELDATKLRNELKSGNGLLVPETVARKEAYALHHDGLVNSVIIYSPANDRLMVRYHPFNLAVDADTSPARFIEYAAAREFKGARFQLEKDVVRDGRRYWRLALAAEYNSHDKCSWIDPARGYLNFVTESTNSRTGQFHSRMFLLEVHEDDGAYFPMHAMRVIPRRPQDAPPDVEVREMKVEELDLSYKPTQADLTVDVPRSAQYSDGINPNTAKTLFREGPGQFAPVSVDEIKGIYDHLQAIAAERAKESGK